MAQSGFTPISLYYSTTPSVAPSASNLVAGELALNTVDEKLYFKNSSGVVTLLASSAGSSGVFTTVDTTNLEVTNVKAKDGTAAATIADSTGVVTISQAPILSALTASQAVFTDASKGLVSNAITGTGNVVMSASPTLTGTISAAAATLSGNLTLSGGTANGVVYLNGSKVATSGSALTFDGTNAVITGTMSATKFIPTGGTATGNGLYLPTTNTLALSTDGTERVRVDASGNVGIGVTPSAWAGGLTAMQVSRGAISGNTAEVDITHNANYDSGWKYIGSTYATRYNQLNGNHNWSTAASGTAGNAITFTSVMELSASGNLGLGVSPSSWAPTANTRGIDVYAQFSVFNATSANSGNGTMGLLFNGYYDSGYKARIGSAYSGSYEYSAGGGSHVWKVAGIGGVAGSTISFTQAMTLDYLGNLGIGTSSPANKLDIRAAAAAASLTSTTGTNQVTFNVANTGGNFFIGRENSVGGYFGTGTGYTSVVWSQGAYPLAIATNNTERMRIDSSGNVGIGTASPVQRLHVNTGKILIETGGSTTYQTTNSEFAQPSSTSNGLNLSAWGWTNACVINANTGTVAATRNTYGLYLTSQYGALTYSSAAVHINCGTGNGAVGIYTGNSSGVSAPVEQFKVDSSGNALVVAAGGLGYGTGSGGAVTQATSRTTGVTLNKSNGAITLVSAAGTTTWQTFTVTNSVVAATDTVIVNQKSGTDLYQIFVTNVAAGSFKITFATTGGTTTEQPVFNFAVIKAVTA